MKIYLAASFGRQKEMREVRDKLHTLGHKVVSRWIDVETVETSNAADGGLGASSAAVYAFHDLEDIRKSDCVISFTGQAGGERGGRHVEFGIGLGLGLYPIVVGPREHFFHFITTVIHFKTTESMLESLKEFV